MSSLQNESKAIISLRHVGVYYSTLAGRFKRDKFWALRDLSMDLYRGETLGIIGRNGAGKTTLIKVLGGIIRPDRGSMVSAGLSTMRLSLQLGSQPSLSGRDNVIQSGLMLGMRRREILLKMDDIIDFSEIGEFIDQPVKTYSSGMGARLAFSVAIHASPEILLIDELLGVGDASFRQKSTTALKDLIQSDKTVVLVSHSPETIKSLCNRAIWLEDRATQMEGSASEILDAYTNAVIKQ